MLATKAHQVLYWSCSTISVVSFENDHYARKETMNREANAMVHICGSCAARMHRMVVWLLAVSELLR